MMLPLHHLFIIFLCLCSTILLVNANDDQYEWMHQVVLDSQSKFHLKWLFDMKEELIIFNVCVQTHGWFGFGISQSGGMMGSDLIVAWVDSNTGRVHLQDRYAEDEEMPVLDDKQDWILESGYENDTHTCVIFRRAFLTCDEEADLPITNDVIRIIWAYDDEDPQGSSALINKHRHDCRGHRSVHLLNHKFEPFNNHQHEHLKYWDITSNNFTLPSNLNTIYWCKIVSPTFTSKAHVIRIEPIISPRKNAPFVHHMVLYRCLHPKPELLREYLDMPGINCLDFQNMPFDFFHCQSIYMVWATGGEAFTMPENVGIPIFEDHETTYFMFEIHYDNPDYRQDVHDSSGLRLYYTEHLRPFQADTATMGSVVDYRLIIPNGFDNFTIAGHCSPECFRDRMPKTGINVLAALPHGHKHLKKIIVRHFRGNEELEPLAEENNYDFNFQDFRRFNQAKKILPGDQITVECTYNTDLLSRPLFGGLSTQEEMCMVFLIYYPRMKGIRTCLSGLTPETVMKLSQVSMVQKLDDNDMNPIILEPLLAANQSLSKYVVDIKQDWKFNEQQQQHEHHFTKEQLIQSIRFDGQKAQCYWRKLEGIDGLESMDDIKELITYPKMLKSYQKPKQKCHDSVLILKNLNPQLRNLTRQQQQQQQTSSASIKSNQMFIIMIIISIFIILS